MEVGKANIAFLTFITCTVTSVLEIQVLWFLLCNNFWLLDRTHPRPFACVIVLQEDRIATI